MSRRSQFYPLYLTRFVGSLGYITLLTLLPAYIEQLGATGVTAGLFVTALGVGRGVALFGRHLVGAVFGVDRGVECGDDEGDVVAVGDDRVLVGARPC